MSARLLTFGNAKGGVGKSTSAAITAYLLSTQYKQKVLAVDMDGQGHLTGFITGQYKLHKVFPKHTMREAILEKDIKPYIFQKDEYLDFVPANRNLPVLNKDMIHQNIPVETAMYDVLEPVMDDYDWIIFDTAPSLMDQSIMPLFTPAKSGNAYVVVMYDGAKMTYEGVNDYFEYIEAAKRRSNPNLEILGVLLSIVDIRAREMPGVIKSLQTKHPDLLFETIIQRRASTRRLSLEKLSTSNKELTDALEFYYSFVKELMDRAEKSEKQRGN